MACEKNMPLLFFLQSVFSLPMGKHTPPLTNTLVTRDGQGQPLGKVQIQPVESNKLWTQTQTQEMRPVSKEPTVVMLKAVKTYLSPH